MNKSSTNISPARAIYTILPINRRKSGQQRSDRGKKPEPGPETTGNLSQDDSPAPSSGEISQGVDRYV